MMKSVFFGVAFAATIAIAAYVTMCQLDKQFLSFTLDCAMCKETESIGVNGTRCCHLMEQAGDLTVVDSTNSSCCISIQPPVYGLTTCQISSDCYQRYYGSDLSDLSLYLNGTREDFTLCNILPINTTPAYQTTSCENCNTTTEPSSNAESKIPSLFTICSLLWIGFVL